MTGTATKTSLKKWIHPASNFITLIPSRLICQMLAFFLELHSKGQYKSSGKQKESCVLVFPSATKHEIRHFQVVVVQQQQRNVQKSVMHVQSCCFANLNLVFCRFRCRHRHCCLSSLLTALIQMFPTSSRLCSNKIWWDPGALNLWNPGYPAYDSYEKVKIF